MVIRASYSLVVAIAGSVLLAAPILGQGKLVRVGTPGKGLGVRYSESPDYKAGEKDRTQFDCRVMVPRETVKAPGKGIVRRTKMVCPHTEQLAAGQCETHLLWGMRCTQ